MANLSKIIQQNKTLSTNNANWLSYWQDLADFALPRKAWINSIRFKGDRLKFNFLYDSTAILALQTMVAGFHSNLTNPSTKWFGLQTKNLQLMENRSIQMWFKDVEDVLFSTINGSNFDTTMQEFYSDYGCFGTGDVLTLKDPKNKVRYKSIPPHHINVEEDSNGRVIAVYWNYKLSAIQAFMLWGAKAGKTVIELAADEKKMFQMLDFIHYVGPRERRDISKIDSLNMPFESIWISVKDEHKIEESGFEEMPHAVGRFWKDANEEFGFSPAMNVLAEIKLLNAGKKTWLRRGMKEADPPFTVPNRGFVLPLNFNPGAANYREPDVAADSYQHIGIGNSNFSITEEFLTQVKKNIEDGFFVPLFRALSDITKQMTVPEVQRRVMENMVLLGPVVGRCTHEVLDPTIIRTFNLLWRDGQLPEMPDELRGQDYGIVYLSPLAKAQRESEMISIEGFLSTVGGIAQAVPDVLDKIDADKTVDIIAKIKGVTPEIIRDRSEVYKIRQARAQAQQAAQQMDAMHKAAAIYKTGAEGDKTLAETTQGAAA